MVANHVTQVEDYTNPVMVKVKENLVFQLWHYCLLILLFTICVKLLVMLILTYRSYKDLLPG